MENNTPILNLNDFSRELKFLLEIIKNDSTNAQKEEIFTGLDWDLFLQLVSHHRLYPSVYKALKKDDGNKIPSHVLKTLSAWYKRNTFQMLQLSAEMEQVCKLFSEDGIKSLFLKGPVLAFDLYSDLSMRTSKDLDILIQIKDLDKVNQLLLDHGYERDEYIRTVLDDWKWKNHHIEYTHTIKGTSLEIHWRMNPGPGREPSFKELWDRKRKSPINHFPVYLLGREDLFVYLITHGARHGWFRLRWLTDIDQMIKQGIEWKEVTYLLKKYNCEHLGGQASFLASQLFGTKVSVEIKQLIGGKKSIFLAQSALPVINQLENLHNDDLSADVSKGFNQYLYSLMTFQQKCFYYIGYIFPVPEDAEVLPLPKKLRFLYFPLRPFLWAWRKTRKQTVS